MREEDPLHQLTPVAEAARAVDDSRFADMKVLAPVLDSSLSLDGGADEDDISFVPGRSTAAGNEDIGATLALPVARSPRNSRHRADDMFPLDAARDPLDASMNSGWGWLADDAMAARNAKTASDLRNASRVDPAWMSPNRDLFPDLAPDNRNVDPSDPFGIWRKPAPAGKKLQTPE
jgi:hypothetical protein